MDGGHFFSRRYGARINRVTSSQVGAVSARLLREDPELAAIIRRHVESLAADFAAVWSADEFQAHNRSAWAAVLGGHFSPSHERSATLT